MLFIGSILWHYMSGSSSELSKSMSSKSSKSSSETSKRSSSTSFTSCWAFSAAASIASRFSVPILLLKCSNPVSRPDLSTSFSAALAPPFFLVSVAASAFNRSRTSSISALNLPHHSANVSSVTGVPSARRRLTASSSDSAALISCVAFCASYTCLAFCASRSFSFSRFSICVYIDRSSIPFSLFSNNHSRSRSRTAYITGMPRLFSASFFANSTNSCSCSSVRPFKTWTLNSGNDSSG
mmetsp:Transcript_26735/g.58611  ORF Transcript_26735/g.58611 Transcript_26735/m.58611 type:complete len:239 (-) Transcript_26735:499-1215(-)